MVFAAVAGRFERWYSTNIRAPTKAPPMIHPTTMPPIAPGEIELDVGGVGDVVYSPVTTLDSVDVTAPSVCSLIYYILKVGRYGRSQ
jgi:hypothetical protein